MIINKIIINCQHCLGKGCKKCNNKGHIDADNENPIIAVDFDGTIVKRKYPEIGDPVPYALPIIKYFIDNNCKFILYTMRDGVELINAINYLVRNGVQIWAVNHNPDQSKWSKSNKIFADLYIDDCNAGTPLIKNDDSTYYVDWLKLYKLITKKKWKYLD